MSFLSKPTTINAVQRPCIDAVRNLARKMYNNRAKLSGFRRMNLKDVVSAMTTLPVEGQIGVNATTQLSDSMEKIVGRTDRNLGDMDSDAHQELASVNMASRSPTSPYLIRRGEYLVCRCHDERIPLKLAQTT